MYNIFELNEKSLDDLKIIATEMGIDDENRDRTQLIYDIIDHPAEANAPQAKRGRRPRISKEAEAAVNEWQKNNGIQFAQAPEPQNLKNRNKKRQKPTSPSPNPRKLLPSRNPSPSRRKKNLKNL